MAASQPVFTSSSRIGHQVQVHASRLQRCPTPTGSSPGFIGLAGEPDRHPQPLLDGLVLVVLSPPMVNLSQPVVICRAGREWR